MDGDKIEDGEDLNRASQPLEGKTNRHLTKKSQGKQRTTRHTEAKEPRRPPKKPKPNPITSGIQLFLSSLDPAIVHNCGFETLDSLREELLATAQKRWVVYHPMVLLPAGSFTSAAWQTLLSVLDARQKEELWGLVLAEIGKSTGDGGGLTHLAVNEGIPLARGGRAGDGVKVDGDEEGQEKNEGKVEDDGEEDNVIRAPTNLRLLHGDFGPEPTARSRRDPSREDFERAFWVVTRQNGIVQTWAPRYTMFSRGNIKEKERLLKFHHGPERRGRLRDGTAFAVDLYAGIGYFAFSYAKLGMRVLCWEINPWSVEALRRGAEMNGWSVRVVRPGGPDDTRDVVFAETVDGMAEGEPRMVVFLEDNAEAARRMQELQSREPDVVHVNGGLLPTSTPVWRDALNMVTKPEGWLHLHENVGVADIEQRTTEVHEIFNAWEAENDNTICRRTVVVEHVEQVKTYAPGVWHCVFDVHVVWPEAEAKVKT